MNHGFALQLFVMIVVMIEKSKMLKKEILIIMEYQVESVFGIYFTIGYGVVLGVILGEVIGEIIYYQEEYEALEAEGD
ncbi:MAG: hypothetical protein EZS28_029278 [Streblomastix strix]|uniref:Uncharacterized protein n=1 Tax=Streblomastix strix TaxID=222440 RepID=A0A5J4UWW0_9EUKA|nr:MAG: hypothetical protein EZS28_029278 [Streblomastix strix]